MVCLVLLVNLTKGALNDSNDEEGLRHPGGLID